MLRPFRHLLLPVITVLAIAGCGNSAGSEPSEPAPSSTSPSGPAASSPAPSSPDSSGPAAAPSSPAATALTVEFRADGNEISDTYFLECDGATPVDGSAAPHPAAACAALDAQGTGAFAPLDPNIMCTQQITGPQRAHVSGTVDGEAVDREFSLTNGCEISRWGTLTGLLGPAAGAL
ncbi:serine protease inhibitor [Arthrobacter citreus]|uniref:serine protease inhibitor n=1 Tax=Arthrobacter TaxID=1663 RepID=UPI0012656B30|nr:serine protease inhibitor [Arthrobacter gandavensis]